MAFAMAFRPFIKFNVSFAIAGIGGRDCILWCVSVLPRICGKMAGFRDFPVLVALSHNLHLLVVGSGLCGAGLEAVAKILNAWPILTTLGALCMLEAALTYFGFPLLGGF